jgi:Ser/Thr protein kinase RdoA (MazF antagonist)
MPDSPAFNELSRRARVGALTVAAKRALGRYDLEVTRLRLLAWNTNVLFRVDTPGGLCVLRLASPRWRSRENLESEALWLVALAEVPEIAAPRVIAGADGQLTASARVDGSPDEWITTLMAWQPGRLLGHYLTAPNLRRMGMLFARLHIHGAQWRRPAGFSDHVFDRYLSRGEPDLLLDPAQHDAYEPGVLELVESAAALVTETYDSLDRRDLRVIHCDLWHDNIKLDHGILRPFDFEDTIIGFRLHDIAMAMLDLYESVGPDRYHPLFDSFGTGYSQILEWPEGTIDPFQAGRLLWILNYVARFQRRYLKETVSRLRPMLERFVQTGAILDRRRAHGSG